MEKPKEVGIGFATLVKICLSYNKPPPLCAKDLFSDEDWGTMVDKEKNTFERVFNEIFAETQAEQ